MSGSGNLRLDLLLEDNHESWFKELTLIYAMSLTANALILGWSQEPSNRSEGGLSDSQAFP